MDKKTTQLLTPKELCERLNIKISNLRSAIYRKKIPHKKVGRLLRFDLLEIENWVKNNK